MSGPATKHHEDTRSFRSAAIVLTSHLADPLGVNLELLLQLANGSVLLLQVLHQILKQAEGESECVDSVSLRLQQVKPSFCEEEEDDVSVGEEKQWTEKGVCVLSCDRRGASLICLDRQRTCRAIDR